MAARPSARRVDRLRLVATGPARAALDVFAIRIASAGFAYGAQVLAARLMGWQEYGIFATVWVWTAMTGHTVTLGLSQGACRFLPVDQARGDLDHGPGLSRRRRVAIGGAALAVAGPRSRDPRSGAGLGARTLSCAAPRRRPRAAAVRAAGFPRRARPQPELGGAGDRAALPAAPNRDDGRHGRRRSCSARRRRPGSRWPACSPPRSSR